MSPDTPRAHVRAALLLLALPLVPALLSGWLHPRGPDWIALRLENTEPAPDRLELATILAAPALANALWIDARPAADFAAGHIPGALLLNEDDWDTGFNALIERWDGAQSLLVYCGGQDCHASEAVARRLRRELGTEDAFVLEGGWDAWRAAQATADTAADTKNESAK